MSGGSPLHNYQLLRDEISLDEAILISESIAVRNANEEYEMQKASKA